MNLWFWFFLISIYGACVGSFLNVVIYRLPVGKDLVTPPSSCPACGHCLAWYDNVPVLGWIMLAGRCRYCRMAISIQYPLIEAVTSALFAGLFATYFMTDIHTVWFAAGFSLTWPTFAVHLVLVSSLVAASMIDAVLYIIPLAIPRVLTIVALLGLPLFSMTPKAPPIVPSVTAWAVGAAAGGAAGLVIANVLLALGLLPRSFDEPAAEPSSPAFACEDPQETPEFSPWRTWVHELAFAFGLILLGLAIYLLMSLLDVPAAGARLQWTMPWPVPLLGIAAVGLISVAAATVWSYRQRASTTSTGPVEAVDGGEDDPATWFDHPHPRREVLKECLFLSVPLVTAVLGARLMPAGSLPTWVEVFAGCLIGYLAGGAVVWLTRILGTLGFGKEAMGLGDVHLLAAIGSVMGWADSIVIFLLAPFFGLVGAGVMAVLGRLLKGEARVIPYGPYLAGAAILVLLLGSERILDLCGIVVSSGPIPAG